MDRETARVEAFSDGVFGIAMTLLILEFRLPPMDHAQVSDRQLMIALLHLWPSTIAFVLSFGTILIMWINHHGLFKHAHGADNRLFFANGFLLLVVTFVPFPTAVLADYLNRPAANVAATFYCATFVLVSVAYNLLLWSVVVNRRAGAPGSQATIARVRKSYRLGFVAYAVAAGVAMFWPYVGVAICFSLWPLWALLRYYEGEMK
ncbi:MAG TPA: TMEM175 family protein [Tepidisphaeraceae bacterium]|nr:TMEM175 family protein [Tepidisphaeraceae bacterium]